MKIIEVDRTEAVFLHLPGQDKNVAVEDTLDTEPWPEKVEVLLPCWSDLRGRRWRYSSNHRPQGTLNSHQRTRLLGSYTRTPG